MKREFSREFFRKTQISNFMKILPVGADLFYAEGRTDGRTDRNGRDEATSNNRFSRILRTRLKCAALQFVTKNSLHLAQDISL